MLSGLERQPWKSVDTKAMLGFAFGYAGFLLLIWISAPGFVIFLDHANLMFHEAGHPFFGLFNSRLTPYGGTLGQLVFPLVLVVSFWRQGEVVSFAAGWLWFFPVVFGRVNA